MLRVAVCVSGGGTNLQAIIDAIESGVIRDTKIVRVISNNKNAYALTRRASRAYVYLQGTMRTENCSMKLFWLVLRTRSRT